MLRTLLIFFNWAIVGLCLPDIILLIKLESTPTYCAKS